MNDQELDQFDDIDSGNDAAPESGSDSSAPPSPDQSGDQSNSQTRINALMSQAQKEEARANRAEAELARLKGTAPASGGKTKTDAPVSTGSDAETWANLLRDEARNTLYNRDPRLAEYGIDKSAITGSTPEEMTASLEAQIKLVDAIETRARNKALVEHGLDPEVGGSSGEPARDFASMSKEEFEKWVAKAQRR